MDHQSRVSSDIDGASVYSRGTLFPPVELTAPTHAGSPTRVVAGRQSSGTPSKSYITELVVRTVPQEKTILVGLVRRQGKTMHSAHLQPSRVAVTEMRECIRSLRIRDLRHFDCASMGLHKSFFHFHVVSCMLCLLVSAVLAAPVVLACPSILQVVRSILRINTRAIPLDDSDGGAHDVFPPNTELVLHPLSDTDKEAPSVVLIKDPAAIATGGTAQIVRGDLITSSAAGVTAIRAVALKVITPMEPLQVRTIPSPSIHHRA